MTQQSNDKSRPATPTPTSRPMSDQGPGMTDQGMFGQGSEPAGRAGGSSQQQSGSGQWQGGSGQGITGQLQGAVEQVQGTLQSITKGSFSLQNVVSDRPLMALGAAVAAGYVLGSMAGGGGEEEQSRGGSTWEGWGYQPMGMPDDNKYQGYSSGFTGTSAGDTPAYNWNTVSYSATSPAGAATTTYAPTPPAGRPASAPSTYTPSQPSYKPQEPGFFDQFDEEIDMLKSAAISTIRTLLRDNLNEYLGKLNIQHQRATTGRPANMPSAEEYTRQRNV